MQAFDSAAQLGPDAMKVTHYMPLNQYFINYFNNPDQEGAVDSNDAFGAKSFSCTDSRKSQFKGGIPKPR
jgi:hypothetical protein